MFLINSFIVFLINKCYIFLNLIECLGKIFDDVIDMLCADGETDGRRSDVLFGQFLGCHLRVGGGVRMNYEALDVCNISQQREYLQRIDILPRFFLTSLDLKCEDRTATIREILVVEFVVGMILLGRMVYFRHLGVLGQEIHYLQGIFDMTFHTQTQRLDTLQKDERIEG